MPKNVVELSTFNVSGKLAAQVSDSFSTRRNEGKPLVVPHRAQPFYLLLITLSTKP